MKPTSGQMPKALGPLLHSGILLASTSAVLLDACFNGMKGSAEAAAETAAADERPRRRTRLGLGAAGGDAGLTHMAQKPLG